MFLDQTNAPPAQLDAPPVPPPPSAPPARPQTSSLTRSPTFVSAKLDQSNQMAAIVMSVLKTNIMINHRKRVV